MGDPFVDTLWLKAIFKALVLPPTGPLLLAVVGILALVRHPRTGRFLVSLGVATLLALSMPAVAGLLIRLMDTSPPLDLEVAGSAQAVVILGGGTRRNAKEYGGDTLGRLTLERVRYGARVARQTGLPVVVVGGVVLGGRPEAVLMQEALEREFGIAVRYAESRSRNTQQNAEYSAQILRAAGIHRIVLIVHSFDVARARAEFDDVGIEVIAAPTGIPSSEVTVMDFVPTIAGLESSYYALYEILANAARLLRHGTGG